MPLLAVRGNGPAGAYGFGSASGKPNAMTAIASTTLSTTATSVTLSSIPNTYDDLRLVVFSRVNTAGGLIGFRFNSDTASNYSTSTAYSAGSTSGTTRVQSSVYFYGDLATGTTDVQPTAVVVDVFNYTTTSYNKTALIRVAQETNTGASNTSFSVATWRNLNAITSVTILNSDFSFNPGSVFALYGIKKAV